MFDVVTGLATVPAVLALVQLAKSFGVSGRWSMLLAVLLGVVLQLGDAAFIEPTAAGPADWYGAAATGLILGLSAAGLYDMTAKPTPTSPTPDHPNVGAHGHY